MEKKIITFNPNHKKEAKQEILVVNLGTIYLDLLLSYDGKNIYFRPSYELEQDIDDELLDDLGDMLKKGFAETIDQIFALYKSNQ